MKNGTKQAVLFDMDGVIIDSEPLYARVQEAGLRKYGLELQPADYLRFKGLSEEAVFDIIEKKYGVVWDRAQVIADSRRLMLAEFQRSLKYMDGFPAILERLPTGCAHGLVTSTSHDFLDLIDRIIVVKTYFSEIVAGGDVAESKPHPAPYREMMRRLRVAPERTVVIEDSINGIRSGKAAGAAVIGLSATYPCRELSEADICVGSLDEITGEMINDI
ncbi:MAG: HAD family phosphatase [Candidatus Neomarinimicrobiota bacterium]